jgi:hypothetical protein
MYVLKRVTAAAESVQNIAVNIVNAVLHLVIVVPSLAVR